MTRLEPGTRVKYGFTIGEVLRFVRRRGIDGYVVQDDDSGNGYGAYRRGAPRWVPASSVTQVADD
jgi:hypothetical protein